MVLEVEMLDGTVIEFPEGTSQDVMDRVAREYHAGAGAGMAPDAPTMLPPALPPEGGPMGAPVTGPGTQPIAPPGPGAVPGPIPGPIPGAPGPGVPAMAAPAAAGGGPGPMAPMAGQAPGALAPIAAPPAGPMAPGLLPAGPPAGPQALPAPGAGTAIGASAGLLGLAADMGMNLKPMSQTMAETEAASDVSWREGYWRALIDEGLFLGAGDELAAATAATVEAPFSDRSWSEIYEDVLAHERGRLEAAPASARVVGNLAGLAIPGSGAFQGARLAATLPGRIGAMAGTGAAFGGLSGFLQGEGGLGPRLEEAVPAAAIGAVAAPVLTGAGSVGGRVLQRIGLGDPTRWAHDKLRQALLRSGLTPREAERRLQDMGPEAIVADLTEDTRRKFGDVFRAPGTTRDRAYRFLEGRQADQAERVIEDTRRIFGEQRQFGEVMDEIVKRQRELAAPLYEEARRAPVEITNELRELLGRPTLKRAARKAQQLAADEGRDIPRMVVENDAGELELVANPDMESFDWIKRALDDRIDYLLRNERGDEARIIVGAKNQMLEILDDQVPVYRVARATWEGEQKAKETLIAGERYMQGIFEDKAQEIAQIPPGKKDLYRLGALRAIEDKLFKAPEGADKVKQIFGSPEKKRRMKALFPDQSSFDAFERRMMIEADFSRTFAEGRGSPTAPRLAEAEDTGTDIAISLLDHGSLQAMIMDMLRRGVISDAQRGALGEVMMRRGPEALQTMKDLVRGLPQRSTRQYLEAHFGKGLGGLSMAVGPVGAQAIAEDPADPGAL